MFRPCICTVNGVITDKYHVFTSLPRLGIFFVFVVIVVTFCFLHYFVCFVDFSQKKHVRKGSITLIFRCVVMLFDRFE